MSKASFAIPDTLVDWPWPRYLHPNYTQAKADSSAWVNSFHPFEEKEQEEFDNCDLNLLACLTYNKFSNEGVRVGCDLMNFYFVYDEYTDIVDGPSARKIADIVMDAMRHPDKPRPENETILGEMARQFIQHATTLIKPGSNCLDRFLQGFDAYTSAVVIEAEDRTTGHQRKFDDYLSLRKDTCGGIPTFALIEFGLALPDEVLSHPTIQALIDNGTILIGLINDINSYVLERARDIHDHNVVTAVMYERGVDIASALEWVENYIKEVAAKFLLDTKHIPSFGKEVDEELEFYVNGIGNWVRGNDVWSFETKRYFGHEAGEVGKHRQVKYQEPKQGFMKKHPLSG